MKERLERITAVMEQLDEDQQDAVVAYAEGTAYAVERARRKTAKEQAQAQAAG